MDIAVIAKRAKVDQRKVRYVLDHSLVPHLVQPAAGRGQTREFDPFQSFAIAVAASLFDAGLPKERVTAVMRGWGGASRARSSELWLVFKRRTVPELEYLLRQNVTLMFLLVDLRNNFLEPVTE